MTRHFLALLLVLGVMSSACVSAPRATAVASDDKAELVIIGLGGSLRYVVDPRTETCLLVSYVPEFAVPVSCAKLKANVPAAARFITWDASKEPVQAAR